ncbi:MAG TPA: hypothetical protein DCE18_01670, partial [Syntrophobacteraceae bacterium]|nr:hypothetical protein [Syntrophobacteraceae bacterium]
MCKETVPEHLEVPGGIGFASSPFGSVTLRWNGGLKSCMTSDGKEKRGHRRQGRSRRTLLLTAVLVIASQLGVGLLLDRYPTKVRFMA